MVVTKIWSRTLEEGHIVKKANEKEFRWLQSDPPHPEAMRVAQGTIVIWFQLLTTTPVLSLLRAPFSSSSQLCVFLFSYLDFAVDKSNSSILSPKTQSIAQRMWPMHLDDNITGYLGGGKDSGGCWFKWLSCPLQFFSCIFRKMLTPQPWLPSIVSSGEIF